MNYSINTKQKEFDPVPDVKKGAANIHSQKKNLKSKKVRTAKTIMKFFSFGVCMGFIPTAVSYGDELPGLYIIPFIPVVLYLINKVITDLKGWYENEEV